MAASRMYPTRQSRQKPLARFFAWCLALGVLLPWAPPATGAESPRILVQARGLPPSARLILSWGPEPGAQASLEPAPRPVSLEITALARHNPAGRGSLVRLVSLTRPDGRMVPESEFKIEQGWVFRKPEQKRALVFIGRRPARATWQGRAAGSMVLTLAENQASGLAEIAYAGRTWTEDLYAKKHANRRIALPPPPGMPQWSALVPEAARGRKTVIRVISPCAHQGRVERVVLEDSGIKTVWAGRDLETGISQRRPPYTLQYFLPALPAVSATAASPRPRPIRRPRDLTIDHRNHNQDASAACGVPDTAWWPRTSFDVNGTLHLVRVNSPITTPRGAPTSRALGAISIPAKMPLRPRPLEGWLPIHDWDLPQGRLRLMALPDSRAADAVEVHAESPVKASLTVYEGKLALDGGICAWQGRPLLALAAGGELTGTVSPDGRRLDFVLPAGRSLLLRNLDLGHAGRFRRTVESAGKLTPDELVRLASRPWRRVLEKAARLEAPNRAVAAAWKGCLAQLFLLRSIHQGRLRVHGTGGTGRGGAYDWGFWYRDYAWHNTALATAGLAGPAADELELFWRHQAPGGLLASPAGQYDGFGQVTRAAFRTLALDPGSGREEAVYRRLLAGARAQMKLGPAPSPGSPRSCVPLLPPGEGDGGISGPGKLVLQHNTWTLLGLDRLARLARRLGHDRDAQWLEERRGRLDRALQAALPFYFVNTGPSQGYLAGALSAGAFGALGRPSWMGYSLFWPQDLLGPRGPAWMLWATTRHLGTRAFGRLPVGLGWEPDTVWPYNALNWAQTLLAGGRPGAALGIFQDVMNTAWFSGTWAEEYFVTKGGRELGRARGGYDVPNSNLHVTAPAAAVLLMRNLVLRGDVDAGTLHLAQGLPWGWGRVDMTGAPTLFGKADFSLERRAGSIRASLCLAAPAWNTPKRIVLHLPLARNERPAGAELNGRPVAVANGRVIMDPADHPGTESWQWDIRLTAQPGQPARGSAR